MAQATVAAPVLVIGADAAVIGTEWPEFAALDWMALRDRMAQPIVLDGRRLLDGVRMRELGFRYEAVGSPPDGNREESPSGSLAALDA